MPIRLNVKKKFRVFTDRVKSVDLHPQEPWVLAAMYTGTATIWNYNTESEVMSFEACEQPTRTAKFVTRRQWVVTGSDDLCLRAYNYNTQERVKEVPEAHGDYIRCIEVHPSQPYLLTSADDMSIKLWNWDRSWACERVFEGHAHYVMQVTFNPKDPNTFASASLDRTVKVWNIGSSEANFTLHGHGKGVNCVAYYTEGDKPYLASGADDLTVKVWDYQTKACVNTMDGHTNNLSSVAFHPSLPLIISGAEDGTVRLWNSSTYRVETTLNYGMERTWALACDTSTNRVACGFDEGLVVLDMGSEMPSASMDKSGKLLWNSNNSILSASLRGVGPDVEDGDTLPVSGRELGTVEMYPEDIQHNSNGRFVAVSGDNEFVIYTAQTLRNKSYGSGLDFVWSSQGGGDYGVRESSSRLQVYKNFEKASVIHPAFAAEGVFGGRLLAVRGSGFVVFYDWDTGALIRRIDEEPTGIYWSEDGTLCALATAESCFVLSFSSDAVMAAGLAAGAVGDEGVPSAFDLDSEIEETVTHGEWVGDCFIYTNSSGRLNYFVGGQVITLAHLSRPMKLLGYAAREQRLYLIDKNSAIVPYRLNSATLEYQTAVVRKDFEAANAILPRVPSEQHSKIAKFLEAQGFKAEAMAVTNDMEHKFDLALQLGQLDAAYGLMEDLVKELDPVDAEARWKQLSDLALATADLVTAERCAVAARDVSGLLLLYTSTGDAAGIARLAGLAMEEGKANVAFLCHLMLGETEGCIDTLVKTNRLPEAAFFARTYMPTHVPRLLDGWKKQLARISSRAADALADPSKYDNLFPDYDIACEAEAMFVGHRGMKRPAGGYPEAKGDLELDLIPMIKAMKAQQQAASSSAGSGDAGEPPEVPADDGVSGEQDGSGDDAGEGGDHADAEEETAAAAAAAEAERKAEEETAAAAAEAERKAEEEAAAAAAAAEAEAEAKRKAEEEAAAAAAAAEAERKAEEAAAAAAVAAEASVPAVSAAEAPVPPSAADTTSDLLGVEGAGAVGGIDADALDAELDDFDVGDDGWNDDDGWA
jgi:coatomer subunit beta'